MKKITVAAGIAFQNFNLVAGTLCKAVCLRTVERIENTDRPAHHSVSEVNKFCQAAVLRGHPPARKSDAGGIAVFRIEGFEELLFPGVSGQRTAAHSFHGAM